MDANVYNCSVVELNKISFEEGNITPVENHKNIPFKVKRVFYIYDIPGGETRGGHAHRTCHQFMVAASGSFEIQLHDGVNQKSVMLNRPYFGLHIPPGIWASETNFSSGAVCLVLASDHYEEVDYITDLAAFNQWRASEQS